MKMDERTKDRLEKLQAEVKLETGEKVTQQELLEKIVDQALSSKEDVLQEFRSTVPASDEEIARFHAETVSSGKRTSEEDVDEILYGEEP